MTAFHTQPRRPVACLFALLLSLQMGKVAAQEADTYYQEQYKLIKAPNAVMALTDSPFGDSVNLYNGRLEFVQTDVSLTGNSALPVAVGRRVVAGELPLDGRQFGIWEMDVPHIHGTFSSVVGWKAGDRTDARCTKFGSSIGSHRRLQQQVVLGPCRILAGQFPLRAWSRGPANAPAGSSQPDGPRACQ